MKNLWIISTGESFAQYSLERFAEEVKQFDFALQIFKPNEVIFSIENGQEAKFFFEGRRIPPADVLLVRTGASTITTHTLALMRFLELSSPARVINSFATYAKAKDKIATLLHLGAHGVPIPKTQFLTRNYKIEALAQEFSFPVVVKEIGGARGSSVVFANSANDLEELLEMLFTVRKPSAEFLIEECLQSTLGRDVRVYVVGDKILGAIERRAQGEGRKANVSLGGTVSFVPLTEEMIDIVRRTQQIVDLEMGGVDLLFGPDGFKVCEVNLSAQFVGFEKATQMNVARTILEFCHARAQTPKTTASGGFSA